MTTMNISLPDELKLWIDQQVQKRSFASSSEYLRDLVRRQKDIEEFHGLIQEGLASGTSAQSYDDWLSDLKSQYSADNEA